LVNRKLKIFGIITLALLLLVGIVSASQESQALVKKGNILGVAKQYDDAISNYDKAISLDPQDADVWYYKGLVLTQEFKINEANAAMDHALLLNPIIQCTM
jgi:tetratricopeptide (TPR) repeat protein